MSTDTLRELALLSQQFAQAEMAVDAAEKSLKEAKAKLARLAEEDIPGLMSELGVKELKMETGEKITVALDVYASIPKASQEACFKWLEENGFESLIKAEVAIQYGREEFEAAQDMVITLQAQGLNPALTQGVHASTLKAFIKEQIEKAKPFPLELFGARSVTIAKIKRPKVVTE